MKLLTFAAPDYWFSGMQRGSQCSDSPDFAGEARGSRGNESPDFAGEARRSQGNECRGPVARQRDVGKGTTPSYLERADTEDAFCGFVRLFRSLTVR